MPALRSATPQAFMSLPLDVSGPCALEVSSRAKPKSGTCFRRLNRFNGWQATCFNKLQRQAAASMAQTISAMKTNVACALQAHEWALRASAVAAQGGNVFEKVGLHPARHSRGQPTSGRHHGHCRWHRDSHPPTGLERGN